MPKRYIIALSIGFLFMIGWNVFLVHRDQQLFQKQNITYYI